MQFHGWYLTNLEYHLAPAGSPEVTEPLRNNDQDVLRVRGQFTEQLAFWSRAIVQLWDEETNSPAERISVQPVWISSVIYRHYLSEELLEAEGWEFVLETDDRQIGYNPDYIGAVICLGYEYIDTI